MLLINDRPIKFFKFSGGEIQVRIEELLTAERAVLTWKPTRSDDIMSLLLTVNALKHMGIYDIHIDCLYLPYARQDRVCFPGEAFSLQVMCTLLDDLNVSAINFWDLHNEEATYKLFPKTNIINAECHDIFGRFKILDDFELENLAICAPDQGAHLRAEQICDKFELYTHIYLDKIRDPDTGVITGMEYGKYCHDLDERNVLIVDDICDGGRTFIEAAKILQEKTPAKLFLYVTHGIFSQGLDCLLDYFEHIYCHHVLDDERYKSNARLTILKEFDYE